MKPPQMPSDTIALNQKLKTGLIIAVVIAAVFTAFYFPERRAVGNHEAYVGVTAREMLNSGDWLVPVFNGRQRLQKTPLCYWLVATAAKIGGEVDDFILRLPSALFAVLSVIAILYFVSECLGFRIAALSALLWATSLGYFRYSHTGRPEMVLAALVTIAMLSFYSALTTPQRKKQIRFMLVFWVSFALAMLAKGPAPLLLILPPLFFYFAVFRKWKSIPKLLPVAGVILFLIIILPWPLAIAIKLPQGLGVWKNEFFGRAVGDYASGGKPFYYYLKVIFVQFAPWSAFVPFALAGPFYRIWEKKQKPMYYLWFWLVISIAAMSLCGGKRQHYILSAIPALAILTGIMLDDMLFVRKAYSKKFARKFLTAYAAVIIILLISLPIAQHHLAEKGENHNYVVKNFALKTAQLIGEKHQLTAYCKVNPSFIYYFGKDVPTENELEKIYSLYNKGNYILAVGEKFEELNSDGRFKIFHTGIDNGRAIYKKGQKLKVKSQNCGIPISSG